MAEANRPSKDTLLAVETAPNMYLISSTIYILTASDLYLQATKTIRGAIKGKHIFEAFPDNPDLPDADGVQNINASLQAVLRTKSQIKCQYSGMMSPIPGIRKPVVGD